MNEYTEKVHAEDHGEIRGGAANVVMRAARLCGAVAVPPQFEESGPQTSAISQPVNSANA